MNFLTRCSRIMTGDRVYDTDIKKVISWYNLLVEAGFEKFVEEKEDNTEESSNEGKNDEPANA